MLVDPSRASALHRAATQQDVEIGHAQRMARALGVTLVVLEVDTFADLIPALNAGKGDLIANNLIVTEARAESVAFSSPTADTQIVLVSRAGMPALTDDSNLQGKTLLVTKGTAYESQARALQAQHPALNLQFVPDNYVDLLVKVADGKADFTIVDMEVLKLVQQFREDLKISLTFPGSYRLAWAFRKNSPKLQDAIDEQVRLLHLIKPQQRSIADLDEIKARGVLRAVTRNHPGTFFMWKGQLLGFEFSLLESFAASLDVRLAITVADSHDEFVRLLADGDADVSASLLAITDERRAAGMNFSAPYLESSTGVVARQGEKIASLKSLSGRTLCVRPASSQYRIAQNLQKEIPDLKLQEIDNRLDIQHVIDLVVKKECDLTIADEISVHLEQAWRDDVVFALDLAQEYSRYAWMVWTAIQSCLKPSTNFFPKLKREKSCHSYGSGISIRRNARVRKLRRWRKPEKFLHLMIMFAATRKNMILTGVF